MPNEEVKIKECKDKTFIKYFWQTQLLGLKGAEWEVYALIYNFSLYSSKKGFFSSYKYINGRLGLSIQTIFTVVHSLIAKNLIVEKVTNTVDETENEKNRSLTLVWEKLPTIALSKGEGEGFYKWEWQRKLGLKGLEWDIYALIYDATQFEGFIFSMKLKAMAELFCIDQRTIERNIKSLIDKGYILFWENEELSENGVPFKARKYVINQDFVTDKEKMRIQEIKDKKKEQRVAVTPLSVQVALGE